jgi:hypothetical protein
MAFIQLIATGTYETRLHDTLRRQSFDVVAVLPFDSRSPVEEGTFLAEGLADVVFVGRQTCQIWPGGGDFRDGAGEAAREEVSI